MISQELGVASDLSHLKHVWRQGIRKAEMAMDLPQGVRAPSWGYPTPRLSKGPLNQWLSVPLTLTSSGCQHSPSFNSRGLPGLACPSLARLPASWPSLGRPLTPRVTQTLLFFVQAELCSRCPSPWVLPSLESLHLLRLGSRRQTPALRVLVP